MSIGTIMKSSIQHFDGESDKVFYVLDGGCARNTHNDPAYYLQFNDWGCHGNVYLKNSYDMKEEDICGL